MRDANVTCVNCSFWNPGEKDAPNSKLGTCQRFPPTPVQNVEWEGHGGNYRQGYEIVSWWPETEPNDWCGEWRPK